MAYSKPAMLGKWDLIGEMMKFKQQALTQFIMSQSSEEMIGTISQLEDTDNS